MEVGNVTSDSPGPVESAKTFLNLFRAELNEAELYLEPTKTLKAECLAGVEPLFSCLRESSAPSGPLSQLYTAGFDEDQIWEEIQLTNGPALLYLHSMVEGLRPELQLLATEQEEGEDEGESEEEEMSSVIEEQSDGGMPHYVGSPDSPVTEEQSRPSNEDNYLRSKVDDDFFSLSVMEQYLNQCDGLSEPGSEGSVGALGEGSSDTEPISYNDFFDPPWTQQGRGEERGRDQLSTHEMKQLKMASQIKNIEEANVQAKSWQMSGEVSAQSRPINSLLEDSVDFDPMTAPAPVVSEETTQVIEDIIRQRILDQAWDDVERKVKPQEKPYDYQRARPLNQEKSKQSLAEVYAEKYISHTHVQEVAGEQSENCEDERHVEIKELKKRLFERLDVLSNFHFTPTPPSSEVHIVSNVSALVMEEPTPAATSQHSLLAPEEIQAKCPGPEKGLSEKTTADRRRQRVGRKRLKRKRGPMPQGVGRRSRQGQKEQKSQKSRHFFASLQQRIMDSNSVQKS